jgi:predicted phage tail protein
MTEVFLEGRLGQVIGRRFSFKTKTLKETLNAIEANTNRLRSYFFNSKKRAFAIFVDDKEISMDSHLICNVRNKKVRIIPILFGAVAATAAVIAAALLPAGASALAVKAMTFVIVAVLAAALSFGISLLISKMMEPDDPDIVTTSSVIFWQAQNVAKQGLPVPVGYGRFIVGSRTVSVNSFAVDKYVFDSALYSTFTADFGDVTTPTHANTSPNDGLLLTDPSTP